LSSGLPVFCQIMPRYDCNMNTGMLRFYSPGQAETVFIRQSNIHKDNLRTEVIDFLESNLPGGRFLHPQGLEPLQNLSLNDFTIRLNIINDQNCKHPVTPVRDHMIDPFSKKATTHERLFLFPPRIQ
jgi:hypothetical protein